ncbi:MAG TPA: hypothetical protein VFM09_10200, partial [Marmoricola sp.]|nr:hypothetical protein [Marmoricola sp.]
LAVLSLDVGERCVERLLAVSTGHCLLVPSVGVSSSLQTLGTTTDNHPTPADPVEERPIKPCLWTTTVVRTRVRATVDTPTAGSTMRA